MRLRRMFFIICWAAMAPCASADHVANPPSKERALGICLPVEYRKPAQPYFSENLSPIDMAVGYFAQYEGGEINYHYYESSSSGPPIGRVEVTRAPKHGVITYSEYKHPRKPKKWIVLPGEASENEYQIITMPGYLPNVNFVGDDRLDAGTYSLFSEGHQTFPRQRGRYGKAVRQQTGVED